MQRRVELKSLADTEKLAAEIASQIFGGQIIALEGPVGAGKTTFTKAFAASLGISKTIVSPTYTLLQPYKLPAAKNGVATLIHIDAYRIESPVELTAIGFEDFLQDNTAVLLIEWAEKIIPLVGARPTVWLTFTHDSQKRFCEIK